MSDENESSGRHKWQWWLAKNERSEELPGGERGARQTQPLRDAGGGGRAGEWPESGSAHWYDQDEILDSHGAGPPSPEPDLSTRSGPLESQDAPPSTPPASPRPSMFRKREDAVDGASERKKSLWGLYHQVEAYEYTNPPAAWQLFDQILPEIDDYTASPDLWHNTAMVAGHVDHEDAAMGIVLAGLRQWPDNCDLLCDALGYYQTTHFDLALAQATWDRLNEMKAEAAAFWRFWVYGSTYLARTLNRPDEALKLLDEGLFNVRRDGLMDILRAYRRILVDSVPDEPLLDTGMPETDPEIESRLRNAADRSLKKLESRYLLGIQMRVENGYVLAMELATLYQERAGADMEAYQPANGAHAASGERLSGHATRYLETALEYLDLAERLYTGNQNHPIYQIYEARARVLMALRRYGEAYNLMRSLPEVRQHEPSMSSMLAFAAYSIGLETPTQQRAAAAAASSSSAAGSGASLSADDVRKQTLQNLFANDGKELEQLVRMNPQLGRVLLSVLQRLSGDASS